MKKLVNFSRLQIYSLGMQLVTIMEQIHSTGFVYNDLQLDNLMMDYDCNIDYFSLVSKDPTESIFDMYNVNIIDFGFATPYIDSKTKQHIKKEEVEYYRGNFLFSSINHLKFRATSRRDDMIALFYLLIYLLKKG